MKKSYLYTVIFIFVVSAFFTLLLASADAFLQPKFQANAQAAEEADILYVFGIDSKPEERSLLFQQGVRAAEHGEIKYYQEVENGEIQAIALPFEGSGLWGTIYGWLAVETATPETGEAQIRGIVFTSHSETPGLGGRIDESWFKEQFRGVIKLAGEELHYGQNGDHEIDAVTGATQTSSAVMRIVNRILNEELPKYEEVK